MVRTLGFLTGRCSLNRQSNGQRRRRESNPLGPDQPAVGARSRLPCHLAPASVKCPSQELNLVYELRGLACDPAHSRDVLFSCPPRNRTPSCRSEVCRAIQHTRRPCCQYPDLDLNQGLDLRRVQCYPLHHRDKSRCQYPDLESNQDQDLRKVSCCPLHHRDFFVTSLNLYLPVILRNGNE